MKIDFTTEKHRRARYYGVNKMKDAKMGISDMTMDTTNVAFPNAEIVEDEYLQELEQWALTALKTLQSGTDLMTPDQLAQWEGVRVVIESCPVEDEK